MLQLRKDFFPPKNVQEAAVVWMMSWLLLLKFLEIDFYKKRNSCQFTVEFASYDVLYNLNDCH